MTQIQSHFHSLSHRNTVTIQRNQCGNLCLYWQCYSQSSWLHILLTVRILMWSRLLKYAELFMNITKHMRRNLIFHNLNLSTDRSNSSLEIYFLTSFESSHADVLICPLKPRYTTAQAFFCMHGWFSNHALKQPNNYI